MTAMKRLLVLLALTLLPAKVWAVGCAGTGACYFAVAGVSSTSASGWYTGSNNTGTNGSVPTSTDDCIFDAFSGDAVIAGALACKNVTFTGYTHTVSSSNTITLNGNLTLGASMILSFTGQFTFNGAGAQTITTNGKAMGSAITVNDVSGTGSVTLKDDLTTTGAVTLTQGVFNVADSGANHAITVSSFSSNNANVRTLTMGSGTWTLTGSNSTIWNISTTTSLTLTGSGIIVCNYSGAVGTRNFVSNATGVPTVSVSAGSDTFSFGTSTPTIAGLTFTGFTGTWSGSAALAITGSLTLVSGMTNTYSGTLTLSGTSGTQTVTLAGKAISGNITVNNSGATAVFADALTSSSSFILTAGAATFNGATSFASGVTHTAGTLIVNNTMSSTLYSGSNANTRSLTLNRSWTLTSTGTAFGMSTSTGATVTCAPGAYFVLTDTSGTARTVSYSGTEALHCLKYGHGSVTGGWTVTP